VPSIARHANLAASISLITLIILCLAWELWLAPLRPGGSWLVLKAVPLLPAVFGILRGNRYTHQWASLLILLYLLEGMLRAVSDTGPSRGLALLETLLAGIFLGAAITFARLTAPSRLKPPPTAGD